jgi:hypothetical protein
MRVWQRKGGRREEGGEGGLTDSLSVAMALLCFKTTENDTQLHQQTDLFEDTPCLVSASPESWRDCCWHR